MLVFNILRIEKNYITAMLSVTLRLLSLVALGAAQTSTVSIWIPPIDSKTVFPADQQDIVASVAGSVREPKACLDNTQLTICIQNGNATTYVLDCAPKTKDSIDSNINTALLSGLNAKSADTDQSCGGFPAPYTIVQDPSTIMWTYDTTGLGRSGKTPSVTYVQNMDIMEFGLT